MFPHWLEDAAAMKIMLPANESAARDVLRHALEQRAEASAAASDASAPVWRAYARSAGGPLGPRLVRLRHALADSFPLPPSSTWGDPVYPRPPLERCTYAGNEGLAPWLEELALLVESPLPAALSLSAAHRAYEDAEQRRTRDIEAAHARGDVLAARQVEERHQQRTDELRARDRSAAARRSDEIDFVRLHLATLLDMAVDQQTMPAVARLAAWELALRARECAEIFVFADTAALRRIVGFVDLSSEACTRARAHVEAFLAQPLHTVRLTVTTKPGIKRRVRAGFEFTEQPSVISASAQQAKLILADDGLRAAIVPDIEALTRTHDARVAELEAQLADRDRQLAAMRTERSERKQSNGGPR